jgi:K+-sensing histidine kinase KdpD
MIATVATHKKSLGQCAVFKIDLRARFVFVDDHTVRLLGCPAETLFGKELYEFVSQRTVEIVEELLRSQSRFQLSFKSIPVDLRTAEGTYITRRAVVTQNFIGGSLANHQFILLHDEQQSDQVERVEEKSSPGDTLTAVGEWQKEFDIGMLVLAEDNSVVYANKVLAAMLNLSLDEIIDNESPLVEQTALTGSTGESFSSFVTRLRSTGGTSQALSQSFSLPGSDEMLMVVGRCAKVAATPLTLLYVFKEGGMPAFGESVDTAAHDLLQALCTDFRAPVSAAEAFLKQLHDVYSQRLDAEGRLLVKSLRDNSAIMQQMVGSLRTLLQARTQREPAVQVNIGQLVQAVVAEIRERYVDNERPVTIDADMPTMTAEEGKIREIFWQLIDNAFKFCGDQKDSEIEILYTGTKKEHQFAVSNLGREIAEDYVEKIFNPFFRIPIDSGVAVPGVGMGLAIARAAVESVGGKIWLDARSAGITFCFSLPVN